MISREEAILKNRELTNFSRYGDVLVHAIYNSIGSCGECEYLKEHGVCSLHSEDTGANVVMMNSDFCSYFERKQQ